jgi:hypothetical protein
MSFLDDLLAVPPEEAPVRAEAQTGGYATRSRKEVLR